MCWEILQTPVKAVTNAKKKKNVNYSLGVLVLASILVALAMTLVLAGRGFEGITLVSSFVSVFLLTLVGTMFLSVVLGIIANTLGGRGQFYEGLTALTYAIFAPSIGLLITGLFMFATPLLGIPVGFVVMILTLAHGFSMLYRSTKELYKMDMITTFVTISVFILVFFAAIWLTTAFGLASLTTMFAL